MCSRDRITCEQLGEQQWTGFWTGLFDLLEANSYCRRAFFLPWSPACFISVISCQGGCPFFVSSFWESQQLCSRTFISICLSFRLKLVFLLQISVICLRRRTPTFFLYFSLYLKYAKCMWINQQELFLWLCYLRPFRFAIAIFQGWVQNVCMFLF